jgi:hypothetical protein
MSKVYDIKNLEPTTDTEGRIQKGEKGITLNLSSKQIPELADYSLNEPLELRVMGKIIKVSRPEMKENEIKADEPQEITLDIAEIEVLNMKEERKRAEEMNVDIDTFKKIHNKRRGGMPSM